MAIVNQREVQIGDQAVAWATVAAPTVMLSGIDPTGISISPSVVTEIIQRAAGSIGPGRDTVDVRHEVSGISVTGPVIYEQIAYWLDMLDEVTPAGIGPYTYTYAAPTTEQAVPRPQTLVMGVGDAVYGIVGACASSITFEWSAGQLLTYTVDLMGHSLVVDELAALSETVTGSLTYALAGHATFAIDAWGGTMGDTASAIVHSGSITINCNRRYNRKSGSLYPTGVYDSPSWNITGNLVLEETAASAGIADAVVAGASSRLIRVDFDNGGAAAAQRALQFDIAALIRVPELMTDDDGMSTINLEFESREEADGGYFDMISTSSTAVLYA